MGSAVGGDHFARVAVLLEGRWTLSICAVLLDGPTTLTGLRKSIVGLSANVLTQRLERLVRDGVVERVLPGGYRLTTWGAELRDLVEQLRSWGAVAGDAPQAHASSRMT